MPVAGSTLAHLRLAGQRRGRAEEERHAAAAELRACVLDAYEQAVPVTTIAAEARISRQAVYEMLGLRVLSAPSRKSLR